MPEPDKAGVSAPTTQTARAPVQETPDNQQTTTQPRAEDRVKEQGSHAADKPREETDATAREMMEVLGIPEDLQKQIAPPPETPPEEPAAVEAEGEPETAATAADTEPDDEEEPEEPDAATTPEGETPKPDKRQKRINRLTRQKAELEAKLDAAHSDTEKLREQLATASEQGAKEEPGSIPATARQPGTLAHVRSEKQLDQEINNAEAWINWCDANTEGATTGEGDNQKFIAPADIAKLRKANEKVILLAPTRRQQIQRFETDQAKFDEVAQQAWPEMFDPKTEEYQVKSMLDKAYPFLKELPQYNYAMGLIVEGTKALYARVEAAKAGNGQRREGAPSPRAIDPKAFAPRVPIAPSTPEPPTREVVPSSTKKLNQAMTDLVTEGGRDNLAAALSALDETESTSSKPMPRRLVKS